MQTTYCAGRKLQIRHSIGRASDVDYSTFDGRTSDVEYSTFDGRPIESKKSDPKKDVSDVKYSTFVGRLIECRKSDIRRRALRMSNIRHSTMRPIELKKSDPKEGALNVEYSTFDGGLYRIENRIESFCTPLMYKCT